MPTDTKPRIKQSVVTVTKKDGTAAEYPLSPLAIYRAGKQEDSPIGVSFHAAWIEAGEPGGTLEEWLGTLADISVDDNRDVPPTNGKPR